MLVSNLKPSPDGRHIRAHDLRHVVSDHHNGRFQTVYEYQVDLDGDGRDEIFSVRESASYTYDKSTRQYLRDVVHGKSGQVTSGTQINRTHTLLLTINKFGPDGRECFVYQETMAPEYFDAVGVEPIYRGAFFVAGRNGPYVSLRTVYGNLEVSLREFMR